MKRVALNWVWTLVLVMLFCGTEREVYGQRVYAIETIGAGTGVTNASNAASIDGVSAPNSAVKAKISVTGSSTTGNITLRLGGTVPIGSTFYVKVSAVEIGGGGGSISLQAFNGTTSASSVVSSRITLLDGDYYRLNTTAVADRIRITAKGGAVLVGTMTTVEVNYAFCEPVGHQCVTVLGTNTNITGVALGSITSPANAIDQNMTTYSNFSVTLGLLATLNQHVYLSNLSNVGDAATVTFSVPSSILSLSLLSNISVSAYNGDQLVSSAGLNSLLSLDLLGLLNGGNRYTVSFVPTGIFDRITISMTNTVGLLGSLRVHEVTRTPAKPQVPIAYPAVIEVCDGGTVTITATSPSAGSILRWYNTVNDGIILRESAGNVDSYTTPPIPFTSETDTAFFYVASSWKTGCPAESQRTKIAIVAKKRPATPILSGASICLGETGILTVTSPEPGNTYHWYTVATGGTAAFIGNVYNVEGSTSTTTYYVESVNSTGCPSATRTPVTLTVNALPTDPVVPNVSACIGVSTTVSVLNPINGTVYRWYMAPSGGVHFITGSTITISNPTTAITYYVDAINSSNCVSGARTAVTVTIQPKPPAPHVEIQPNSQY